MNNLFILSVRSSVVDSLIFPLRMPHLSMGEPFENFRYVLMTRLTILTIRYDYVLQHFDTKLKQIISIKLSQDESIQWIILKKGVHRQLWSFLPYFKQDFNNKWKHVPGKHNFNLIFFSALIHLVIKRA